MSMLFLRELEIFAEGHELMKINHFSLVANIIKILMFDLFLV
jgi:hypothetical protein